MNSIRIKKIVNTRIASFFAASLPILIFSAAIVTLYDREQRRDIELVLRHAARSAVASVEQRLTGQLGALQALAGSPALEENNPSAFQKHAQRVLENHPDWVTIRLSDATTGRAVMDLATPPSLAHDHDPDALRAVAETGRPEARLIQDLTLPHSEPIAVLRVPVWRDGAIPYILCALIKPEAFSRILLDQGLPSDWIAAVLDPSHFIAGRTRAPDEFVGTRATPSLIEHIDRETESFFFSQNKEGKRVYTAFSRSPLFGWTVAVGAPDNVIEAPIHHTRMAVLGGGALAFAIAVILAFIVMRAVSRRHAAETQLATERRLSDIAANFPGAIYRRVMHPDGRISYPYMSEGLRRLIDQFPTTLPAPTSIEQLAQYIAAEDRDRWRQALAESARNLTPYDVEGRLVHAGGSARWVRSVANVHRGADGTVVWDGVILDITPRKEAETAMRQSEARVRAIVEAAADGIITINEQGKIESFNRAAEQIFGYAAQDVIGQDIQIVMPPAYRHGHQSRLSSYVATGKAKILGRAVEVEGLRRDGRAFPMELSIGEAQVDGKRIFAGVVRDITERKKVEADLREALEQKNTLLKEVHHRVKNNLQIIISMLHLQRRQTKDDAAREQLNVVAQRVQVMANLHQQLYEHGNLARIDFGEHLDQLVSSIAAVHGRAGVEVRVQAEAIQCDLETAIPLGMIANELISNAYKHAFPDGRTGIIDVRLHRTDEDGVELSVADNGIGLLDTNGSGGGIGKGIIQALARQIDASLSIDHQEGLRTRVLLDGALFRHVA